MVLRPGDGVGTFGHGPMGHGWQTMAGPWAMDHGPWMGHGPHHGPAMNGAAKWSSKEGNESDGHAGLGH